MTSGCSSHTDARTSAASDRLVCERAVAAAYLRDGSLVEIEPDALQQYFDVVNPAFQQASLDRQALDQEYLAPGPNSQVDDAAAWFERASDHRNRLVVAVMDVDPYKGGAGDRSHYPGSASTGTRRTLGLNHSLEGSGETRELDCLAGLVE